jgi:hypothetical protein
MKNIVLVFSLLSSWGLLAQHNLPIIKATYPNAFIVDANEGKTNWTLSPDAKPDVYTSFRTRETKWVSLYTDVDSIKVKIDPGTVFDFVVLLNDKDSCYTQFKSAIPKVLITNTSLNTHDTIPFTLTAYNAICIKSIINDSDTLNLHFDIGSFDFRLTKDAILHKTTLLSNQADVLSGKAKADYNQMKPVFKIKLGNLAFDKPEVIPTGFTSQGMDGRFGWNIFEGKSVEIDYDKHILIIHSQLPKIKKGYSKSKIEFYQSFACIKGHFTIEQKIYKGLFIMDTGSDLAIIMDSTWLNQQKFPKDLKHIKTTTLKDPRGAVYENKIVLAPQFNLNGFTLNDIPTSLLGGPNPTRLALNFLGNDLLKRFNAILDFKKDYIYLKPNSLTSLPYKD